MLADAFNKRTIEECPDDEPAVVARLDYADKQCRRARAQDVKGNSAGEEPVPNDEDPVSEQESKESRLNADWGATYPRLRRRGSGVGGSQK
jgi:hypothetical protein